MNLLDELRSQVEAYLQGEGTLVALHDWLDECTEEIAGSTDPRARNLANDVWFALDEYDARRLSERDMQLMLGAAFRRTEPAPA